MNLLLALASMIRSIMASFAYGLWLARVARFMAYGSSLPSACASYFSVRLKELRNIFAALYTVAENATASWKISKPSNRKAIFPSY
jgi:hypothetical protein